MARLALPSLGPRTRKALRIVGYVLLALGTFVLALQLTFPYDRVKAKIEEALSEKYAVNIVSVERGWVPGRVYFNAVTLQTRPTKPEDPVTTVFINRLEVDVDFLPLLRGAASVNLDAQIGAGHLRGNATISKAGTSVAFEGTDLPSQMLPMTEAIGLPMTGTLEFEVRLDLPNEKQKSGKVAPNWQKAEGGARIACPSGCTFGDGKTKLKTKLKNQRNQAFAAEGIEFGKVSLKSLLAKVEIKTGQLTLTQFEAPTDDGEIHVDYMMELQPSFDESSVTGCLRFNGSKSLLDRDQKTFSAITATGALLGPDNLFHIRLTDKFKDMKRLAQPCGGAVSGKSMDSPSGGRPTLQVQPDEPVRTEIATPPTPAIQVLDAGVGAGSGITVPTPGPEMPGSAAGHVSPEGTHGSGVAPPMGTSGPPLGEPLR
jgi:type II secretion system protein N